MPDLSQIVGFEWDDGNRLKSSERHSVSQAEAEQVFADERLFIADDHSIFREGVKSIVSRSCDMQIVGEAEETVTLPDLIGRTTPDVLVLDISMPGLGVLETIRRLKTRTGIKAHFPSVSGFKTVVLRLLL